MKRDARLIFLIIIGLLIVACRSEMMIPDREASLLAPSSTAPPAVTETPVPFPVPHTLTPANASQPGWEMYTDNQFGFTVSYPPNSTFDDTSGEARIYLPVQPDTNLSEKYLILAPRHQAESCSGEAYLGFSPSESPPEMVTLGGSSFSKESGHDAGAGNIFSYISYSTTKEDICLSLIFVLHSTNPANYDNPPPEYNWEEETAVFEEIVSTLRWR
ncbi:MAG: hypothetical protein HPY45_16100 [Anaerolineae bacterium]|nr:hypothetical protein [Anaerolineae bacterium]